MGRYFSFILVAVLLTCCFAQNDSNNSTNESPESTRIANITIPSKIESSLDQTTELPKKKSATPASRTENTTGFTNSTTMVVTKKKAQDPMRSKICESCICSEGMPFLINCGAVKLEGAFLFPDWPNDAVISSIDAVFDGNQFDEITQFPELPILRLSYRSNSIQYIQKAAFKNLKLLEYLDLSENKLTHESINANAFEGPFNEEDYEPLPLKTLKLGYNNIHSIDKDAFNHLSTHLEILELNNNPLKVIDHQTAIAITTLRKLKVLNLAETKLNSIPDGVLHALSATLKWLILSGNQFNKVPEELQNAINLEYLNLNNNPITGLNSKSFQGLVSLKRLNISSMPYLELIDANTFTPLTSMIHLWCSNNPNLKKINSKAFNNMIESDGTLKLSELHFRGNNITTLSSKLLTWENLDLIDIGLTSFYCDCRIGWITTILIPFINDKMPEWAESVTCSGPEEYKGHSLESLTQDKQIVNCSQTIDEDDVSNEDMDDRIKPIPVTSSNVGLMIVSMLGILIIIGGVACMAMMALRKSHLRQMYDRSSGQIVHYVRTASGATNKYEDEHAIVSREFTNYDEEP